jgi:hypothetical protein
MGVQTVVSIHAQVSNPTLALPLQRGGSGEKSGCVSEFFFVYVVAEQVNPLRVHRQSRWFAGPII